MTVTPTFYTRKGEPLVGDTFEMQPAEVKTVDLKTLMPRNIRNRQDLGGMSLSHTGKLMEMWGQLRLLRVGNGGSVDVTFVNLSDKRSDVRNAVWSMPDHGSAVIAIGNAGARTVKAKLQFSDGDSQEIDVPSFGTELVRKNSQPRGGGRNTEGAEAVRITAADGSSDLVVAGAVTAKNDSFTSSIRFYDTKNVAQQNLYATNFRLHGASSKLVLRNTGAEDIIATPRFRPVKGDPNDFIDLGGISLKPDETKSIDLDSLSQGTHGRSDFDTVSVDILNSGSKGSLIGALNGVDQKNGLTYDVPLRDSGGPRNLSGAYPWRLDGDVSTIVSITNVTSLNAQFVVQINYPGGPYLLDPQTLPAGGTAIFDLRQIRDQQIPDRNGHAIPRAVQGGQFRWYIRSGGHLIGRAEMLSVSRGISSSYSCGNPCPPHYDYGYIDPENTDVPIGDSEAHNVLEIDVDSYENPYGPYSATVVAASTSDSNIATFDGSSVTGVNNGDAGTSATVEYPLYWWEIGTYDCTLYGTTEDTVYGSVTVPGAISLGSVSFTYPTPPVIRNGDTAQLTIVLNVQSVNPGTSVRVLISTTDATGGELTLNFETSHTEQGLVCTGPTCTKNVQIGFTAATNPTATGSVKAHVAIEAISGTTPSTVTVNGSADSSNSLTVQRWP